MGKFRGFGDVSFDFESPSQKEGRIPFPEVTFHGYASCIFGSCFLGVLKLDVGSRCRVGKDAGEL